MVVSSRQPVVSVATPGAKRIAAVPERRKGRPDVPVGARALLGRKQAGWR
jgi:hypothetical protein